MRYIVIFTIAAVFTLTFSSCEKKEEPREPVAAFTVNPSSGSVAVNFLFNASGSQDDEDPLDSLKARWDFDGDGFYDTPFSYNKVAEHRYESAGNYHVTLEVMNTKGWTDTETKMLYVYPDSLPPVASFNVLPDTASVNTIFYFTAATSYDPYTPVDKLRFRWDWQSDGSWDTPYLEDTLIYRKFDNPGDFRILLEVKNEIGLTDTTSRLIHVYNIK